MLPVTAATQHLFPGCCLQFLHMETGKHCRKNFMRISGKLCTHSAKIVCAQKKNSLRIEIFKGRIHAKAAMYPSLLLTDVENGFAVKPVYSAITTRR